MLDRYIWIVFAATAFVFNLCGNKKAGPERGSEERGAIKFPGHFPPVHIPEDNVPTAERVALGKRLFYDRILSRDSSVSCASCHAQQFCFGDTTRLSLGVGGSLGRRNAMPLANLAWSPHFFWDGSSSSLEEQVSFPIENPLEMNNTMAEVARRLNEHPEYPALFQSAYETAPDEYAVRRAIASFERALISADSPFDRFVLGDSSALTASQQRGLKVFEGAKAACSACHNGYLQTDFTFQNIGLYAEYPDAGRFAVTGRPEDRGAFKTPSLRNVAVSAPYMHDGSMNTLEEVVEHYETGGAHGANVSDLMLPFKLSEREKADLVNFMRALTDTTFLENPAFQP